MNILRRCRTSISAALSLWFCAFSLVLVLMLSEGIYLFASNALTQEITARLNDMAHEAAARLDEGMHERYREIGNLAKRRELSKGRSSTAEIEKFLGDVRQGYPYYSWIGLVNAGGVVEASTNGLLRGHNVSRRPWFFNAKNGNYVSDVHDAKLLQTLIRRDDPEPLRFVDFAFPLRSLGASGKGFLAVHMDWKWAQDVEKSVMASTRDVSSVDAFILDREGKVILGPRDLMGTTMAPGALDGKKAGAHTPLPEWANPNDYLLGSSVTKGAGAYPGLGWTVVIRQRTSEAFAPVIRLRNAVLAMGLAITFLFFLAGRLSARRITQPIRILADSARSIAEGEGATLQVPEHAYTEVAHLASSLEAMVDAKLRHERQLIMMNASLEERVAERTHKLQMSKARLRTITNSIPVLIAYLDKDLKYHFCNNAYEQWHDLENDQALGRDVFSVMGPSLTAQIKENLAKALDGEQITFEVAMAHKTRNRYLSMTYIPEFDEGQVVGIHLVGQDVTEARKKQIALEHEVLHDSLTRLPNRQGCVRAITHAIERAKRVGTPIAVMFLDLNKFKAINDTYGHNVGDDVLRAFAARVRGAVRETDTVCRYAGDEFVVIAENLVDGDANAVQIAQTIVESLRTPLEVPEIDAPVTTSIGIVVHASGATTPDDLLDRADMAMYNSKTKSLEYTLYSEIAAVPI